MQLLVNFLLFQAAWFACVLGGANDLAWVGPLVVMLVAAYHLWRAPDARAELVLLAAAAVIGVVFDSLLTLAGWLAYPSGQWHPALAPYWIVAMWVAFATTLNVSLAWLQGRPWLAALFGAAGGPLAYLAGSGLGAVSFVAPLPALIGLAVGWALIMPLLAFLAARLDGWPRVTFPPRAAALAE